MPSPFPGMDPWLEARGVFPSFHNTYIASLLAEINKALRPPYFAAIGTRVVIEQEGVDRYIEPDVDILKPVGSNGSIGHDGGNGGGVATALEAQPVTIRIPGEFLEEWYLDVRTGEGDDELVTSLEVLSPSNKQRGGEGRDKYRAKQRELRERGVNLVEIDLLRDGLHTTVAPLAETRLKTGPFDYHICTYRPGRSRDVSVYAVKLPQRLPPIEVPLGTGDAGIRVELQAAFDHTFDIGLFARLRYGTPCDPALAPELQSWAEAILREKGLLPAAV